MLYSDSKSAAWGEKDTDFIEVRHDENFDTGAAITFRGRKFENGDQKLLLAIILLGNKVHYEHIFDASGEPFNVVFERARVHAEKVMNRDFG